MLEEKYDISGMHCAACSASVERVTRKLPGVERSEVNLTTGIMTICYDESLVGQPRLVGKAYQEVINTFNTFTVDTDVTQEQLKIYAGARVDLVAYAIQAEGFTSEAGVTDITKPGSAVTKAWNAIVATYPYESGVTG